jgi:AsmA protein
MRWLIRSVLALTLLVVLAFAALLLIPTERIARIATDRFTQITGRALVIEGSLHPTFWPELGVKTGPVSVSNADWSDAGPMLVAEGLEIGLDMGALMDGRVRVTAITAKGPILRLERAKDGRANWEFGGGNGGTAAPGMAGEGTPFALDVAQISGGQFSFVDHKSGARIALSDLEGTARIPTFAGSADFAFSGQMNGQTFDTTLKLTEFSRFLDGKVTGAALHLQAGKAVIDFAGRGGWNPMVAEGQLTADLADLSEIARLAAIARPAPPQGLGAQSVAVSGKLTLSDKASLHLRGGRVQLDGNSLTAEADLTTAGPRPKLSAQLGAAALSLTGLAGGKGGGAEGGVKADGWPKERIDVSALGLIDATIALTADSIDLGLAKFGASRLLLTIERARAVFDLKQVAAYGGRIAGQFVVNGRGGLSVGGDLRAAGLSMQALLRDLGGYERLIGTGDLALKFLSSGNSLDALMHALSGSGSFKLGKGELLGLDIGGMLRNLDPNYVGEGQKTIFEQVAASFAIDQGVLQNDDLVLVAPYVTATGSGRIGIGARNLDYRLRPTALAEADGTGGVMVPLLISGSWAKPKFRLDLESIAKERLDKEAKAAEARLKAQLEQKVQDKLGVQRQEGESLEDAAKRRAQEALDAEAARLLNRLIGGGN